jgi:hypothetical protein
MLRTVLDRVRGETSLTDVQFVLFDATTAATFREVCGEIRHQS